MLTLYDLEPLLIVIDGCCSVLSRSCLPWPTAGRSNASFNSSLICYDYFYFRCSWVAIHVHVCMYIVLCIIYLCVWVCVRMYPSFLHHVCMFYISHTHTHTHTHTHSTHVYVREDQRQCNVILTSLRPNAQVRIPLLAGIKLTRDPPPLFPPHQPPPVTLGCCYPTRDLGVLLSDPWCWVLLFDPRLRVLLFDSCPWGAVIWPVTLGCPLPPLQMPPGVLPHPMLYPQLHEGQTHLPQLQDQPRQVRPLTTLHLLHTPPAPHSTCSTLHLLHTPPAPHTTCSTLHAPPAPPSTCSTFHHQQQQQR